MNILILNPILYSGDGNKIPKVKSIKDTMIYGMCLGFKSLGHNITLIAVDEYRPIENEKYDFEILFFKNNLKNILPSALPYSQGMYKYIKRHGKNYDMILSSETFGFHSLFAALYVPGNTAIWQELNLHQHKFHTIPSKIWHNIIVPMFFKKIRVVIPRSESAYIFISRYMRSVSNVKVDHGINIEKFKVAESKKRQFISVAQFIYRKNIDGIIRKFYEFIQDVQYGDFKLFLAGRGPMESELRDLVSELGINHKVNFLGFLDHKELNHFISESYAFLVNTRQDLNMVSIPESIVAGTPVITNMVPALANYINENRLGIAKDDWGKNEMSMVIENKEYQNNCILFREKLSTKNAAKTIIDIFHQYENPSNK